MALKAGLQLKLAQHLTLTPQLQQSIRLLQLSTLELHEEIASALAENPLLELTEGEDASDGDTIVSLDALTLAPDREHVLEGSDGMGEAARDVGAIDDTGPQPPRDERDASATADDADDAPSDDDSPTLDVTEWGSGGDDDDTSYAEQRAASTSLAAHLRAQVVLAGLDAGCEALLQAMIDSLDDDGYLRTTREELEALLPRAADRTAQRIDGADWHTALRALQSLDPAGVGARDLRECLLLQLATLPANAEVRLARRVVDEELDALGRHDYVQIRKRLGISDEDLRAAHAVIRTLSPRPGSAFADVNAVHMIPDVIVRRSKRHWVAELNPAAVPRLAVNAVYAEMLRRHKDGRSTALTTQLQEARWLVKNVAQRFDTILRVASEIVVRQQAFFDHGAVAMRPLVLREVADALGLHESTVSRVTTQKYLSSVRGSFEFKYFFGSHVATDAGGAASSTAIRAMIKSLIAEEDPNEPLTDSRIAEMLGADGIIVARRTVAKYRELLNIAPVNLRRRG